MFPYHLLTVFGYLCLHKQSVKPAAQLVPNFHSTLPLEKRFPHPYPLNMTTVIRVSTEQVAFNPCSCQNYPRAASTFFWDFFFVFVHFLYYPLSKAIPHTYSSICEWIRSPTFSLFLSKLIWAGTNSNLPPILSSSFSLLLAAPKYLIAGWLSVKIHTLELVLPTDWVVIIII